MSVIVKIPGKTDIDTGKENAYYTFCHDFTKDVILGLHKNNELDARLQPFMDELAGADCNNIAPMYICMSKAVGGLMTFDRASMNTVIQAPGLILFSSGPIELGGSVQHSMIALRWNEWQGANNMGSLGAVIPTPSPVETDMYVLTYPGMDTRDHNYQLAGGWAQNNKMCSRVDNQGSNKRYTMYYIPL